jgi:hypothetical protein
VGTFWKVERLRGEGVRLSYQRLIAYKGGGVILGNVEIGEDHFGR